MNGLFLRMSDVESDRSMNCATTPVQNFKVISEFSWRLFCWEYLTKTTTATMMPRQ